MIKILLNQRELLVGPNVTASVHPQSLGSNEERFVRTERIDMRNIIVDKKSGLLIRLKSFSVEAAVRIRRFVKL